MVLEVINHEKVPKRRDHVMLTKESRYSHFDDIQET